MRTVVSFIAIALMLAACPSGPQDGAHRCPPPIPCPCATDASGGNVDAAIGKPDTAPVVSATVATACANLQRLGCPEGMKHPACIVTLGKYVGANMGNLSLSCLSAAQHVSDVRACGVACPSM